LCACACVGTNGALPSSSKVLSQGGEEQLKVAIPVAEEPDKEKAALCKRQVGMQTIVQKTNLRVVEDPVMEKNALHVFEGIF